MSKSHPKILFVEDNDHSAVTSSLMQKYLSVWQNPDKTYVVNIKIQNSADEVLNHDTLSTYAKQSGLKAFGVIVDADMDASSRWRSIMSLALRLGFENTSEEISQEGFICINSDGLRFGAWVMPDNISSGMVENFCKSLSDTTTPLWSHAEASCSSSLKHGAEWKQVHKHRAEMFTWLAWQDPPLGQMGRAILKGKLNHEAEPAKAFIAWFKKLYEL